MRAKIQFCFWIVFLGICSIAHAQREPVYIDALFGDSIKAGKKVVVKDSSFYDPVLKPTIKHTYLINNLVSLRINEELNKVMPDSFTLSVKVKIIYTAPDTLSDSIPEKILTINYNKNKTYDNKAVFFFTSAHYVEVQVLQVSSTFADTSVVRPLALLENRMVIQRDYDMSCTDDAIHTIEQDASTVGTFGELKLSWTPNHVSQFYDVEWTYIDQSAVANGRYSTAGHLDPSKIFKNNATRITTKADTCMIPLLYDGEGFLVYRIRGVQIDPNGELQTTNWNTDTDTTSAHWKYYFTGHERELNWQASTTFAEEGKRKSVVQYFDGSLRARQVVTRDNTTQTTVVAETMYDKQGRPVIQVMPAPTLSTLIHYTPFFNVRDMNGAEYDKAIYDTMLTASDYCNIQEDSMSVLSGASQYYSSHNPLKSQGIHQFIPNAHGYAFTQTQYTQDNTGRVYAQGGVDSAFRLGSGRETKFFYFAAKQSELDALFGTEVGDASHYQKNMVRDANGQYSVSYVDMHGRTIATALAGNVPSSLDTLSSWRDVVETDQLLTKTNNLVNGSSVDFSTSMFMTREDDVTLHYSMAKQSLSLKDCKDSNICYSCLYDLTIKVTGDCAGCVSGKNDTTIQFSNFPLWRVDTTCDLAIPIDTSFILHLKEGGYNVTKSLAISKLGMDKYRDSVYLLRNSCSDYDSIYRRQMKLIKDSLSCSVDTLNEPTYMRYREIVMMDVTPLVGQYGHYQDTSSCFSIFNKATTTRYYYQIAADSLCYKDDSGNCDIVVNSLGQTVKPEQLTPDEFIANFKDSWLQTLVVVHPEYRRLLKYEQFAASLAYDDDFEVTDTYAEAVAKGYLNPTSSSSSPANKFTSTPGDPLYAYSFANAAKAAIEDSLFHLVNIGSEYVTAWGLATASVKCSEVSSTLFASGCVEKWNTTANVFNTDSLCTGDLDMAWRTFRAIYLKQKRSWIENYVHNNAGVSDGSLCIPVFSTLESALAEGGYNPYDNEFNQNIGSENANAFYESNCEAYADTWKEQLGDCYTEAQKDSIIKYLTQVCINGADSLHPFGSSTISPSSTYQYQSFQQVFTHYNNLWNSTGSSIDTVHCNAYRIDKPLPYSQPMFVTSQEIWSKPDSCSCTKINSLYSLYQDNLSSYNSFSQFMLQTQGTIILETTLDSVRNLCNGNIACNFLSSPINLPPALQCSNSDVCINCIQFNRAYTNFVTRFPTVLPTMEEADTVQQLNNRIFANYMNQQFGFAKTAQEYLAFSQTCSGYTDTLVKRLGDFKDYYYSVNRDQLYGGYKVSPAAIEFVNGANAAIQARQYLDGSHLQSNYGISSFTYNFDAKLRSVIRSNSTDSAYQVIVPHPLQNSIAAYDWPSLALENNVVIGSDFINGMASLKDLSYKYYGVTEIDAGNYFRCIWASKNTTAYIYYGAATPLQKYLPDTPYHGQNHIYNFTFFKPGASVTSSAPYVSFFNDSVWLGSNFSSAAIYTNTIRTIKNLRFAPYVLPLSNMNNFVFSSKGLIVTLEMKDGTESDAFIYNNHENVQLQWKEAIDSNLYDADCRKAFTYFFNQQDSTNYTSTQIDSIYIANGIDPSYCGQSSCDSLTVDTTGVPKPSSVSCDQLITTYKNFMADFPHPERGATVQVHSGSSGEMMFQNFSLNSFQSRQVMDSVAPLSDTVQVSADNFTIESNNMQTESLAYTGPLIDSFLIGRDLLEWYFNTHLNLEGYTYENFMDWLVNDCHYKLHQLPLDGNATICCDTLQNLLDSFIVKYPIALGNTITETKSVPVHKVLHAVTNYTSSGTVSSEYVFTSGAGINALTWTSGYWLLVRDNVSFNFRVLPENAIINSASLNLYAKTSPIEYFPCCGAHYRRTTDSIFGIFERLTGLVVPGQTLPSTLPATDATHSFTLAPVSISNGAGGGTDLFSDQNYLDQNCTSLVRDLYTSAANNNNYGLLFRLNNESLFYKAYNFWGITSNTPTGNLPHLQVNYTASRCDLLTAYINNALGTHLTSAQVAGYYRRCGIDIDMCDGAILNGPRLCGNSEPMNEFVTLQAHLPCQDSTDFAIIAATQLDKIYRDSLINYFNEAYTKKCLNVSSLESFTISKPVSEYHYTLYYYDQAGNLVKTIPPEGVHPNRDATWLAQVKTKREAGEVQAPSHLLPTVYRYNSLNQVVSQKTPDGGLSKFWYDRLGRLAISQNAQQKDDNTYSYTKYDAIGRITEVGQKLQTQGISQYITRNPTLLATWLSFMNYNGNNQPKMVTLTTYDIPSDYQSVYQYFTPFRQKSYTLRNRVSRVRTFDIYVQTMTVSGTDTTYTPQSNSFNNSIEYSYDIHGNVDSMLNVAGPSWANIVNAHGGNRFKLITYKYDLISGRVNEVHYQPSNPVRTYADEFYHRYEYDAENRLTDVYTTDNKAFLNQPGLEEHDAHYEYYKHGPLARMVLGQQQVQGVDYAYTLQGWLKGVNSTSMHSDYNMGQDGKITSANKYVARDEYGFNLNYFTGEYAPINENLAPFPGHTAFMPSDTYSPLYNGNISSMAVNIKKFNQPQLYNYRYDQLNRFTRMDVYRGFDESNNNWDALAAVPDYHEHVSYDANGNILSYVRHGHGANIPMDSLTYYYWDKASSNQLRTISDGVTSSGYTGDLTTEDPYNYKYNKIGNSTNDWTNGVSWISWNVYGKITSLFKHDTGPEDVTNLGFLYDPNGNRIEKDVWYNNSTVQRSKKYWYVRDAQGNVMAVYMMTDLIDRPSGYPPLYLVQQYLYGSSRLGVIERHQDVDSLKAYPVSASLIGNTYLYQHQRGNKLFELTNHLGNVLVTISDKKQGVDNNSDGVVDYYTADVASANDYYPFGMMMPGRSYSATSGYRYGFNGKENDNEVKGEGNEQDYGLRIYDPRVGRFLSVDPLQKQFPFYTPYQFASNRPIDGIDLDGGEFLSNSVAMFYLSEGKVLLKNEKVPEALRDAAGKPQFDAAGVGLTSGGIATAPSNYVELRQGGYNNLPSTPWTFAVEGASVDGVEDLYRFSNGTSYYSVSSGVGATPFTGITPAHTLSGGLTGLVEGAKYVKMFQSIDDWDAKRKLNGQIQTFDKVAKLVDQYITMDGGLNTVDAFASGQFTRDQLINFVLDGSLPEGGVFNPANNLDGMLNMMYYGLQLINMNTDQYNAGDNAPYIWSGGAHKTHVSDETLRTYEFAIGVKKAQIGKGATERLGSYSDLLDKLKR